MEYTTLVTELRRLAGGGGTDGVSDPNFDLALGVNSESTSRGSEEGM